MNFPPAVLFPPAYKFFERIRSRQIWSHDGMHVIRHYDIGTEFVAESVKMVHRYRDKIRQMPMTQFAAPVTKVQPPLDARGNLFCESFQCGCVVRRRMESHPFAANSIKFSQAFLRQ